MPWVVWGALHVQIEMAVGLDVRKMIEIGMVDS